MPTHNEIDRKIAHYDALSKDYDHKGTLGGLALGMYYQGIADGLRMVRDGSVAGNFDRLHITPENKG